jgi:hypothetical protein
VSSAVSDPLLTLGGAQWTVHSVANCCVSVQLG